MGSSSTASKGSPDRELALDSDNRRWMVTGVPAGIAIGASAPVGKIPPFADVPSKGRFWSAETVSSEVGRLSRREHPLSISPNNRTEKPAKFRQFPFDIFIKQ